MCLALHIIVIRRLKFVHRKTTGPLGWGGVRVREGQPLRFQRFDMGGNEESFFKSFRLIMSIMLMVSGP